MIKEIRCSKCNKILQNRIDEGTSEEKIESFEFLWYQLPNDSLVCIDCMGDGDE
jgi:hypothetical protein